MLHDAGSVVAQSLKKKKHKIGTKPPKQKSSSLSRGEERKQMFDEPAEYRASFPGLLRGSHARDKNCEDPSPGAQNHHKLKQ